MFQKGRPGHFCLSQQQFSMAQAFLKIVDSKRADDLKKVRYWIVCGDDDFLSNANCKLHILMTDKKVPHEFQMLYNLSAGVFINNGKNIPASWPILLK